MKKVISYISLIASVLLFVCACDSRLDIEQMGVLSSDIYYQTDDDAQEALAALYGTWASNAITYDYQYKILFSDECYNAGSAPTDNEANQSICQAYYDATNSNISTMYSGYYTIINRANLIIDAFQEAQDTQIKKLAVAEARFFRAWCYFDLVTLWGNPPLVTKVLSAAEGEVANTPGADTWEFIESELKDIINSGILTEKAGVNDTQAGIRPTKQTAQAYLAKAYLFQGKYSDALPLLESVINSGKYALAQDADYANLFHHEGNYSPEYLLSNNTIQDDANGYPINWTFVILGNWIWGNSNFNIDYNTYLFFMNGYDIFWYLGYGFFQPTGKIGRVMEQIEGKDGFRKSYTLKDQDQMVSQVGAYLSGDGTIYGNEGYFRFKRIARNSDLVNASYAGWGGCAINLPSMRYAEVLMMAAEAAFKTGSPKAVDYFNQIRDRAKAPQVSSLDMDTIQNEYFAEFAFEGHRFQDLQRWDKNGDINMVDVLKDKGKKLIYFSTKAPAATDQYTKTRTSFAYDSWTYEVPTQKTRAGFDSYEKLLPYPQSELDVNKNIEQNPGWETIQ